MKTKFAGALEAVYSCLQIKNTTILTHLGNLSLP